MIPIKRLAAITLLTFSATAVSLFAITRGNEGFAFTNGAPASYQCALPVGYSEVSVVVSAATSQGIDNPYSLRATVSHHETGVFYVQRVNQVTGYYDALEIQSDETVVTGEVLDLSSGTLKLIDGKAVLLNPTVSHIYDQNPYGIEPSSFDATNYGNAKQSNASYSRYVTINNLSYESSSLSVSGYRIVGYRFASSQYQSYVLSAELCGVDSDAVDLLNSSLVSLINADHAFNATGILTHDASGDVLRVFSVSDAGPLSDFNPVLTGHNAKFYLLEATPKTTFDVYRIKDHGDIDYIDFNTGYALFNALLLNNNVPLNEATSPELGVYRYTFEDYPSRYYEIDTREDTFYVSDSDFLYFPERTSKGHAYMVSGIETNICEVNDTASYDIALGSGDITFDYGDYDIDLVGYSGVAYIPVSSLLSLFFNQNMVPMAYNGSDIFFTSALGGDYGQTKDHEMDALYYSGAYASLDSRESHFAEYNYNQLCFDLDHFYGLKDYFGITSYDTFFEASNYADDLRSTNPDTVESALATFAGYDLFEGHSGLSKISPWKGVYNQPDTYQALYSMEMIYNNAYGQKLYGSQSQLKALREAAGVAYDARFYEDMAVFPFDSFVKSRNTKNVDPTSQNAAYWASRDTYMLFRLYFAELAQYEADSGNTVKSVVIDDTLNGGGMVDSLPFLLAFFSDDPSISYRNAVTGEATELHYSVDLDQDGVFGDNYVGQYDFYLLTSNFSFSCGNAFPTFIDRDNVTIIGETSGGGSCWVGGISTASGTIFSSSSINQFGTEVAGKFVLNEAGVTPDYAYARENFYNDAALRTFINSLS